MCAINRLYSLHQDGGRERVSIQYSAHNTVMIIHIKLDFSRDPFHQNMCSFPLEQIKGFWILQQYRVAYAKEMKDFTPGHVRLVRIVGQCRIEKESMTIVEREIEILFC
jgi:hypothetical protein